MTILQFSKTLQQLPTQFFSKLVKQVNAAKAEGRDIINLGQGNPDQPTPDHIIKELQRAAADPESHRYSPFSGKESLKKAICSFYEREYGVTLQHDTEVAILFGGKIGLVELPLCFCDEGDLILAPDPGYPDYLSGISLAKATTHFMPLEESNQFLPDYNQIPSEIAKQAKLMFLNYPNNPTGATATKEFFEETVAFAKQNDVIITHDFAYGALGFGEQKPLSFMQTEGAKEVGVEIYTLSKTFNMAGWRVAFAVGNVKIIEAINLIQDHMYVSLFPAIQDAAVEALMNGEESVKELVALYKERRDAFVEKCATIGWHAAPTEGSFFVWMPVAKGFTSELFATHLLDHADVAVAPGIGFGEYGEGYVRVGLVENKDRLLEAVDRIAKCKLF
ncbi:pyridoxal phosphate-dependent aminotransferase [Bacillus sp. JJ722]|uniref:pyridoxal phosphate-dependent aminotransferase n=1 Tax=Bacillus sp. JJ722 TaxID=3122973 RepID=UPI002FFE1B52